MSHHRATVSSLAVFSLTFWLASCGPEPYHQKNERYVFVTTNVNLPYWQEAQAGLQDAARALGVKAEMVGPESFAPDQELDAFQKAIAQKPSGILISVARPEMFKSAIDGAIEQGIPVICVDADAPDSRRVMFVGTDNLRAGMESGKRLAEMLHGQGHVVIISIPGQLNIDERVKGANEALKKYPGIKVVQTLDDKGDPRTANDVISAVLAGKEKIDGIICLEASGGAGVAEALHRLDRTGKVLVVAFDKEPETLDFIQSGAITATIGQKPYVMSYYGLKFADDLHHNAAHEFKDWRTAPVAPMPTFVDTGTSMIDKNNLQIFREALSSHPKPM
jgi:ribose transport system substrate-binding protein